MKAKGIFYISTFIMCGLLVLFSSPATAAEVYKVDGVTRPLTVKVEHIGSGKDPWGGYRAGFETSFMVKRSDFGMTNMLGSVGDEVRLTVNVEGIRQ